jgi:hypothetical protein
MAYCRVKSDTGIRFCVEFHPYNQLDAPTQHQLVALAGHCGMPLRCLKVLCNLKSIVWRAVWFALLG